MKKKIDEVDSRFFKVNSQLKNYRINMSNMEHSIDAAQRSAKMVLVQMLKFIKTPNDHPMTTNVHIEKQQLVPVFANLVASLFRTTRTEFDIHTCRVVDGGIGIFLNKSGSMHTILHVRNDNIFASGAASDILFKLIGHCVCFGAKRGILFTTEQQTTLNTDCYKIIQSAIDRDVQIICVFIEEFAKELPSDSAVVKELFKTFKHFLGHPVFKVPVIRSAPPKPKPIPKLKKKQPKPIEPPPPPPPKPAPTPPPPVVKKKKPIKPKPAPKKETPPPTPPPPVPKPVEKKPPKPVEKVVKRKPSVTPVMERLNPTAPKDPPEFTDEFADKPCHGTVKWIQPFDSETDAKALRKAMKGFGTDEKAIYNILCYRANEQRQAIALKYKSAFGRDLVEDLKSELSANFEDIIVGLMKPIAEYDACELKKATKGLGTDDSCLIEILCTRGDKEKSEIKEIYKTLFKKSLEDDVIGDTSGNFKKLLVAMINAKRETTQTVDLSKAKEDAKILYDAGEAKWGTNEEAFITIFATRSPPYLRAVFSQYKGLANKTIVDALKSEMSGNFGKSLKTLVAVIEDRCTYFAEKLYKSMKGLGTKDSDLVRIVTSRCELDMVEIKEAYQAKYNDSLENMIRGDTSGDYRATLLALISDQSGVNEGVSMEPDEWVDASQYEDHQEYSGTVTEYENFDAEQDATFLRKAMKGLGTDESMIIGILCLRNNKQRQDIASKFKTLYGRDLIEDLKSELSGDIENFMVGLMRTEADYDASEIKRAVKGLGTDDDALVEILCSRTNAEIDAMKEAYEKLYQTTMEKDVKGDTSGDYQALMISMVTSVREEGPQINLAQVRRDAKALLDAGELKRGTDEEEFNLVLATRSFPHLKAMFDEYRKLANKDLSESVSSEMSGNFKSGLKTIIKCVCGRSNYFAEVIYKSMKGLGTDDQTLARAVISRSEKDLVQIKEAFQAAYSKTMEEWVKDDTGGDFQAALLAVVAGELPKDFKEPEVEPVDPPEWIDAAPYKLEYTQTPVIKEATGADLDKDVQTLRKAMKGFGTDEDAIIGVVCARNNAQRQVLKEKFKQAFGRDLLKDLESELSGKLETIILGLMESNIHFDAQQIKKAVKGFGTDDDCLVEILCTRTNEELSAIKTAYQAMFNKSMEADVKGDTSGTFQKLLVSLMNAARDAEPDQLDKSKCKRDAKILFDSGEGKLGTNEEEFVKILATRSYAHLRCVFEEYKAFSGGKDLSDSVSSEFSGDIKNGLKTIVACIKNRQEHFAKTLHKAMKVNIFLSCEVP